jgi:hypothetical protein
LNLDYTGLATVALVESVTPSIADTADLYADRDDDWDEIEQQEIWLASADSDPFVGDIDSDVLIDVPVEPSENGSSVDKISVPHH